MNQFQFMSIREAKRKSAENRKRQMIEIAEKSESTHPHLKYPISVEVFSSIPKLIPSGYEVNSYASFPIPENKSRMFLLKDKVSFENFRAYLRVLEARFEAKVLPCPRHPYNVLKGF